MTAKYVKGNCDDLLQVLNQHFPGGTEIYCKHFSCNSQSSGQEMKMRHSEHETRMLTISDLKVKCIGILTGHLYRKCMVCVKIMASAIK
jgi:hypothetical protein